MSTPPPLRDHRAARSEGSGRPTVHRAWHALWAIVWSTLRWDARAARHIDAWLVLGMDELSLHVLHPNDDRIGCRIVPTVINSEVFPWRS